MPVTRRAAKEAKFQLQNVECLNCLPTEVLSVIFNQCSPADKIENIQFVSKTFNAAVHCSQSWAHVTHLYVEKPNTIPDSENGEHHKLVMALIDFKQDINPNPPDLKLLSLLTNIEYIWVLPEVGPSLIDHLNLLIPKWGEKKLETVDLRLVDWQDKEIYAMYCSFLDVLSRVNQTRKGAQLRPLRLTLDRLCLFGDLHKRQGIVGSSTVDFCGTVRLAQKLIQTQSSLGPIEFSLFKVVEKYSEKKLETVIEAFVDGNIESLIFRYYHGPSRIGDDCQMNLKKTILMTEIINKLKSNCLRKLKIDLDDARIDQEAEFLMNKFLTSLDSEKVNDLFKFNLSIDRFDHKMMKRLLKKFPKMTDFELYDYQYQNELETLKISDVYSEAVEMVDLMLTRMRTLKMDTKMSINLDDLLAVNDGKPAMMSIKNLNIKLKRKYAAEPDLCVEISDAKRKSMRYVPAEYVLIKDHTLHRSCEIHVQDETYQ